MINVVDSSGWIEYFLDTASADNFAAAIEQTDQLIVPALSFFEVHRFLSRITNTAQRETCLDIQTIRLIARRLHCVYGRQVKA